MKRLEFPLLCFAMLPALPMYVCAQSPVGTEFTYQGRLILDGELVNTATDLEFRLWDAESGGSMIGSVVAADNVDVVEGLFTVELDFGATAFNGEARWLEVQVRIPAGGGAFTTLDPRQSLSATPYALQTRGLLVEDNGNVGIGTADALGKLHVAHELNPQILFENTGDTSVARQVSLNLRHANGIGARINALRGPGDDDGMKLSFATQPIGGSVTDRVTIDSDGNVGIGTSAPDFPLQIDADGTAIDSYPGATGAQQAMVQLFVNGAGATGGGLAISNNGGFFDLSDGFITYLPLSTGTGLKVQGAFRVVNNAWPDYVFDDDYDLNTLAEVEAFIRKNGHLPNVPSADEVHAKGVDVSVMNAALLRTIEELTLHVIKLRKEFDQLKDPDGRRIDSSIAQSTTVTATELRDSPVADKEIDEQDAARRALDAADSDDEASAIEEPAEDLPLPDFAVPALEGASGNTVLGDSAGASLTSGTNNTLIGDNAGMSMTSGSRSVLVGKDAGRLLDNDVDNVIIGYLAGSTSTSGTDNVIVGTEAGVSNGGADNTFIGNAAGKSNTMGSNNTFVGEEAGLSNTTGSSNTFVGEDAGFDNTTGRENTAVGRFALHNCQSGFGNTVAGHQACFDVTIGVRNTALGDFAGVDNGEGHFNTYLGGRSGESNEFGDYNTFVGALAGFDNNRTNHMDDANRNTYLGAAAGHANQEGSDNVAIGAFADFGAWTSTEQQLFDGFSGVWTQNPAGAAGLQNASRTVMVGASTVVSRNDAIGIGYGARSTAVGGVAIGANASGSHINAITIGNGATSHANDTAVIGSSTIAAWHPGADGATELGSVSYRFSEVNAQRYNAIAGAGTSADIDLWADNGTANDDKWRISAADGGDLTISSLATGSYTVKLAVDNGGNVTIPGEISVNSDARLKRDIRPIEDALDVVERIEGKTYLWSEGCGRDNRRHYGLIAQEVEAVIPELVTEADNGIKSVKYQALVPVLLNAIRELNSEVVAKDEAIANLERRLQVIEQTMSCATTDEEPSYNSRPSTHK